MKWILPDQPKDSDLFEWIIKSRNIEDREKFFNPQYSDLHSPMLMYGMKDAAEVILKAINDKKKIFIHGDFDVDGITATTLLWQFLYRDLNADVLPYIPNRFDEGYGLSDESITAIIDKGADLIITVDCGVKDINIVEKYRDKVDFIITDHHTLLSKSQKKDYKDGKIVKDHLISKSAKAVVHPVLNNQYPFTEICGAFISFKLVEAINQHGKLGIDTSKYLELASLGTICDVMPLIDENRSLVSIGLNNLKYTKNKGLNALFEVCKIKKEKISTYHIGYILGPRLNAAGRLGSAIDAVKLLSTDSEKSAYQLALKLDHLNKERQDLTLKFMLEAEKQIGEDFNKKIHFIYGDKWPEGIVGLIAGKLMQKYNRPFLIGSILEDGNIKGSARSIENFDISSALKDLSLYLIKHGGHSNAAGFTLNSEFVSVFREKLNEIAENKITLEDLEEKLIIDGILGDSNISLEFTDQLSILEPYGQKNHQPTFALVNIDPVFRNMKTFGKDNSYLKLNIVFNGNALEALVFNNSERYLELLHSSTPIDLAGNLDIDEWNGNKKLVMRVKDIRGSL